MSEYLDDWSLQFIEYNQIQQKEQIELLKQMKKLIENRRERDLFSSHIVEVLEENHLVNKEEVIMEIELY